MISFVVQPIRELIKITQFIQILIKNVGNQQFYKQIPSDFRSFFLVFIPPEPE